jgi:nucleotide-binding universal stress UspA family protein
MEANKMENIFATKARIMVPLDGSSIGEAVLPHATTLAMATSAALDLVRVVEPHGAFVGHEHSGGYGTPETMESVYTHQVWQAELGDARDYLSSVRRRIGVGGPDGHPANDGLEIGCQVLEGDPALMLVQQAERDPRITMIAMTTHGRSGVGRWPLGSVTEKVLCATAKPLLVVRPTEAVAIPPAHSYRCILVPLDGSVLAEQALDRACTLALGTGAALLLVSVVPSPDDMGLLPTGVHLPVSLSAWQAEVDAISCYLRRTASELCERTPGLPVEVEVVAGRPADAILSMSGQAHADLIVMSTHGLNAAQDYRRARTWLGSVALKVVQSAHAPVLLLRPKEVCDLGQWAENEGLENHLDSSARTTYSGAVV